MDGGAEPPLAAYLEYNNNTSAQLLIKDEDIVRTI